MKVRSMAIAAALFASVGAMAGPVMAQAAGLTVESTMGDLMASPAAKAVLEKHIPQIVSNPQISQAAGMSLKGLQSYVGDQLTDEVLAKIDADLKALPKS